MNMVESNPCTQQIKYMREIPLPEANICAKFQRQVNLLDPDLSIWQDPKQNYGSRPEEAWIRDELKNGRKPHIAVRQAALRRLIVGDYTQMEKELRSFGHAFIPTQP